MRIAVLLSAVSENAGPDDQDTLAQAVAVANVLRRAGHEVRTATMTMNLSLAADTLRNLAPDVVFNLVETVEGGARMAHLAPLLLEHLGTPFTGSGSQAMYLSTNKLLAKAMLAHGDLPTPSWRTSSFQAAEPGRTFIVKSVWEHASLGLDDDAVISSPGPGELSEAIKRRERVYCGEWFAEEYVRGREFNVSMIQTEKGLKVLHPAEIIFKGFGSRPAIVGYKAKWDENSQEYTGTLRTFEFADCDTFLLETLRRLASDCWRLFGLSGYARVDFRVDQDGRPYIIDINANPCLTPDAGFAAALGHSGLGYDEALLTIIANARGETRRRPKRTAA